ncbi:AMP-binding protein [Paraferrimonas sp. SM1919]|uniref:AMP-binding protein n=1 Tax=Paraferrimonas sp. SM1919 TaxID=2662263 RepID=UPI0013D227B7|nr:AMP-binding protein [Paraferrimonas sp. SM1919]
MTKLWVEKSYPKDVPATVDIQKYLSINEIFDKYSAQWADIDAFISLHTRMTYRQLAQHVQAFSNYLRVDLGLKKGDKFAIMMPNCLQYPIAIFAALQAGLVVVNVNPLYTPRELEHQMNDSGAKGILIIENFASTLEKVIDKTSVKHVITTQLADRVPGFKGALINFMVKHVKKMVPKFNLNVDATFNQALKLGAKHEFQQVEVIPSDLAFLQYTGGTTGVAKGAMLSHRNIVANLQQMKASILPAIDEGNEILVTALPLYHIFALTCNCLAFMTFGGTNLLISNPRDFSTFAKTIAKYPFTAFTGVNTLYNGLMNAPEFKDIDFSHLKFSVAGGMATQEAVANRWQELTGSAILEGFGLTECSPCASSCPYNQRQFNGSVGLPLPSTDMKVVDEEGNEQPIGQPGEIWLKGPQVMEGYYNRPEATAEVIKDGWLATGDIGVMDENGYFSIVDRKKDMIIVSGFNVFPNEIEEVLVSHPDVIEAAAIGVPCAQTGEKIKIYLATYSGRLNEQEMMDFCRTNLTNYKVPREFELMDELPKSNVGKILRKDLREATPQVA